MEYVAGKHYSDDWSKTYKAGRLRKTANDLLNRLQTDFVGTDTHLAVKALRKAARELEHGGKL